MTKSAKFGLCIGAAVLAGVAIGMLFAPSKGTELRGQIKDKAKKALDKGKGIFSGGREEIKEDLA